MEYIPSESSEVNSADKEALFNTYFGISPENLKLLKDISSTLRSCGKSGYMNDLRTFMAMFMRPSLPSHAQFMDLWEDALASVRKLRTRPITEASDITEYLSELCATVNSAAIFIAFIADDEPRYQLLLRVGLLRRLHRRIRHLRPVSAAGRAACRRCRRAAGS